MPKTLKIGFAEIPATGLELDINDESWFPDHEIARQGPVSARTFLEPKGEGRILLTGEIRVPVSLECDRCLQTFALDLAGAFKLDLEYEPDPASQPAEHSCSGSEMDTVFLAEPVVDLAELLAQQVYLALPAKKICSAKCKGLCPECGANLNDKYACICRGREKKSPFGMLAGLKVKK